MVITTRFSLHGNTTEKGIENGGMAFDQRLRINMPEHECAVNLGSNHTSRSVHLSHHEQPNVPRSSAAVYIYLYYTMSWKLPAVQLPTEHSCQILVWSCISRSSHAYYMPQPLLTYSKQQNPSWRANRFSASLEIPRILRNPKVNYRIHNSRPPVPLLLYTLIWLFQHLAIMSPYVYVNRA